MSVGSHENAGNDQKMSLSVPKYRQNESPK